MPQFTPAATEVIAPEGEALNGPFGLHAKSRSRRWC